LETTKQFLLTTISDLTLRYFTCNSITSGGVNLNTSLNAKQDKLTAGTNITIDANNYISSNGGVTQEELDSTAKLNSANTFTGLQTILDDLKADYVLNKNKTPTLTTHLTSKLYVDTALNGKQNTLLAGENITITNNTISSTGGITQEDLY
jgi:hypothetical protein